MILCLSGIMPSQYKHSHGCKKAERLFYIHSLDSINDSLDSVDVVLVMVDASISLSKLFITDDLATVLECIPNRVHKILVLNKVRLNVFDFR